MKLYNTLTKSIEEFTPYNKLEVRIYSCGPTVYNDVHIGNISSFIHADTLRRSLESTGIKIKHAMNITDVDDKTIKRSREQAPDKSPMDALMELTTHYTDTFMHDMNAVGNNTSNYTFIKATDNIDGMKSMIENLYNEGFAYVANDGVYFSIKNYRDSGKKYGQLLEITQNNTQMSRIHNDEYDKDSPHDFALWKTKSENEPVWPFTLDGKVVDGRPGWHIECSVMSKAVVGQPFDIHTGGIDLIFPHHENEIAQSTAGQKDDIMAKFFYHNEHLLIDGKKMSKSLDNFYTIEDLRRKGINPLAFRLLVLQSHYRHQANFSWINLDAANNRLNGYQAMADLRFQATTTSSESINLIAPLQAIVEALQDDVNTPRALEELSNLQSLVASNLVPANQLDEFNEVLSTLDELFGLELTDSKDINHTEKDLISKRETARSQSDWSKSDSLRDDLLKLNIDIRDTPAGQVWSRIK